MGTDDGNIMAAIESAVREIRGPGWEGSVTLGSKLWDAGPGSLRLDSLDLLELLLRIEDDTGLATPEEFPETMESVEDLVRLMSRQPRLP
jgi:hypothetical protein